MAATDELDFSGETESDGLELPKSGLVATLVGITVLMSVVEFGIMVVFLHEILDLPPWEEAALDSLILSAVVGPVAYFCLVRPRERHIRRLLEQLDEARKDAERRARVDGLTHVLTRRAIFDELEREWTRSERYPHGLSCLMIDVDHFKRLNDSHGHQAGDVVLEGIADVIKRHCRATDRVGRYGGEEFLVLLPETDLGGATALAERMRMAIAAEHFEYHGAEIRTTVSVGVAHRERDVGSAVVLVSLADDALYRAKDAGRNRVEAGGVED
jgi:diguanylate cyclase (GGDEF)-like protein